MLATVSAAIMRFRRRLLLAAFVGGFAAALTVLAMVLAATLIVLRFVDVAGVSGLGAIGLGAIGVGAIGVWPLAAVVVGAALVIAAWRARRLDRSHAYVAEHLEHRLATGGLLLAAVDGGQLDRVWQGRLDRRLAAVGTVLPTIRWARLVARPAAALALLAVVMMLPAPDRATAPGAATTAAVERLAEQVEAVAALPEVPAEQAAELRAAASDLERRAAAGETDLWRQIDQLHARLERERRGSGDGAVAGGAGGGAGAAASGPAPHAAELAAAMQQLAAIDRLDGALARLPEQLRQQVEAARTADGRIEPDALPTADEALRQLGRAIGEHAGQLADDGAALARLAKELQGRELQGHEAAGEPDAAPAELAEQLAAIAEQFGHAGGTDPGAMDAGSGDAGGSDRGSADPGSAEALAGEVAKAAADMAAMGGFDQMPEVLRNAMLQAAASAAESALQSLDIDRLRALLPDDLPRLRVLAESLAGAAEQMAGSQSTGRQAGGEPSLPELSDASKQKLEQLARGLAEQLAGMSTENAGGSAARPAEDGAGSAGGSGNPGDGTGSTARGPGHTALRLTEHTVGGVGNAELGLPATKVDPTQPLPGEWLPVATDKAEPEVGEAGDRGAGASASGGPAAAGTGASGTGTATWQLRLAPRHRAVVRRFFEDAGAAAPATGTQQPATARPGKDGK